MTDKELAAIRRAANLDIVDMREKIRTHLAEVDRLRVKIQSLELTVAEGGKR